MRRFFQFRLRTLVAAMLAASLLLAWFASARSRMEAEEAAIARIGSKQVDWTRPTPRWTGAKPVTTNPLSNPGFLLA